MIRQVAQAFLGWARDMKEALTKEKATERLSEEELEKALQRAFKVTRDKYTNRLVPVFSRNFLEGMVEAGFGVDEGLVDTLAVNYSRQIVDYANKMSSRAAAEAYRGIINRRKPPKQAFEFMTNSFGVDRNAVRSLLKMFDRDEDKDLTFKDRQSKKKEAMDKYVVAALDRRAKKMAEEEPFRARETSKALVWNLAKDQGLAPEGAKKRWITARDELVCETCGPMHGQTVELDEKFTLPDRRTQVWAPQLHINCRCRSVITMEVTGVLGDRPSRFTRVKKNWDESAARRDKGGQFASVDTLGPRGVAVMDRPRLSAEQRDRLQVVMAQPEFKNRDVATRNAMIQEAIRLPQAAVDMEFDELKTRMRSQPRVEVKGVKAVQPTVTGIKPTIRAISPVRITEASVVKAVTPPQIKWQDVTVAQGITLALNQPKVQMVEAVDLFQEAVAQQAVDVQEIQDAIVEAAADLGVDIKAEELTNTEILSQAKEATGVEVVVTLEKPVYGIIVPEMHESGVERINAGMQMTSDVEVVKERIDEAFRAAAAQSYEMGVFNRDTFTDRFGDEQDEYWFRDQVYDYYAKKAEDVKSMYFGASFNDDDEYGFDSWDEDEERSLNHQHMDYVYDMQSESSDMGDIFVARLDEAHDTITNVDSSGDSQLDLQFTSDVHVSGIFGYGGFFDIKPDWASASDSEGKPVVSDHESFTRALGETELRDD